MARSITEIQDEMFMNIAANDNLAALNSQSKSAIYRLFVYIVAYSIWVLEVLFDTHKSEIDTALYNQKSGTLPWYRTMALAFQYGFDLQIDSDKFDNGTATEEEIEASKIVKYAAVNESTEDSRVIIKIAGEDTNKVLSPITSDQLSAFEAYIKEVRYAGVKVTTINYLPDRLYLTMQIYRDPLVIDAYGNSIRGGRPVEDAITAYMKELPFNGELVLAHLVDKLQTVDGVKIPNIVAASSSWIDPALNDYGTPQPINVKVIPVSGYFEMQTFDNITYVV
jgi:hypothetical protein